MKCFNLYPVICVSVLCSSILHYAYVIYINKKPYCFSSRTRNICLMRNLTEDPRCQSCSIVRRKEYKRIVGYAKILQFLKYPSNTIIQLSHSISVPRRNDFLLLSEGSFNFRAQERVAYYRGGLVSFRSLSGILMVK